MWGRHRARVAAGVLACGVLAAGAGSATASGPSAAGSEPGALSAEVSGTSREIFAGGPEVYLVDTAAGTVQWLHPIWLVPRGPIHELGSPIGRPVVDPEGVLWAAIGDEGTVTGVFRDKVAKPIRVANPGHSLQLALASGRLVAFDHSAWKVITVGPRGPISTIEIPRAPGRSQAGELLLPAWTEGPLLPLVGNDGGLSVVDFDAKSAGSLELKLEGRASEPQAYGHVVEVIVTSLSKRSILRLTFPRPLAYNDETLLLPGQGEASVVVRNGHIFYEHEPILISPPPTEKNP